ncbi:MAG TPA: radical SAM protein [Candidatus Deferrimicrobium sp.]|nr:radical SAM protein [Candidatus Deferrimicrobium sp.]
MERNVILQNILVNPSTNKCEKILVKLLAENSCASLLPLFKDFSTNENEYARIFAALGFGYLTGVENCDLEEIYLGLQKIADDWSGKVITYGLVKAMVLFFQNKAEFIAEKFENAKEDSNPAFFKAFLIAYAKYTIKSPVATRDMHFQKITQIIEKNLASDDILIQNALVTAVNTLGNTFAAELTGKLNRWAEFDNVYAFEVICGALDKSLGKKVPPAFKNDLLKRMDEKEHKRIKELTQSFQIPGAEGKVRYIERVVQTLLHRINVWFLPFNWGANPYRGCVHSCDYCYARTSHEYLGNTKEDFERVIYVKINAANALEKDLSTPRWIKQKNKLVNLGSVTDPYQKIEEKYEITRKILEVFLAHQNPVTITTKSPLVGRDADLLKELGPLTNVVFSIPTLDQKLADIIEKNAPPIAKRFEGIETLKKAGIVVGVLMVPIMPYINDNKDDIRALAKALHDYKVDYVIPDILNLRGDVKIKIAYFLEQHFPSLIEPYKKLYTYGKKSEYADKTYLKDMFDFLMKDCLKEYGLNDYSKMIKGKWQ